MLLLSSHIKQNSLVGAKARQLKKLNDEGFLVPAFGVIPASVVNKIFTSKGVIDFTIMNELLKEIVVQLPFKKYAVRSSALIEDGATESFAGQFSTRINVPSAGLFEAISEVLVQARTYLRGDIKKFACIIQEYIEPDYAGITFTRNPLGGREMVVEYHTGRGEAVVGGKIKPEQLKFFWTQSLFKTNLPQFVQAVENFKQIENLYQAPQDIEWCVKDGKWYFLQARPITSIANITYQQNVYLDSLLDAQKSFWYAKTEVTEIAPRPTSLVYDMLSKIYTQNGPIDKVYKKYKITYRAQSFLKIIGNELYIDKEAELKTLLPAYGFLKSFEEQPRLVHWQGFMTTFKNSARLNKISLKKIDPHFYNTLVSRLKTSYRGSSLINFLELFWQDYALIFEINLLTSYAFKRLESLLKKEHITLPRVLVGGPVLFPELTTLKVDFVGKQLVGNSLDIADESPFVKNDLLANSEQKIVLEWWNSLSPFKKNYFTESLKQAVMLHRMREWGRWLVVKRINELRKLVFEIAKQAHFEDLKLIYFAHLEELLQKNFSEQLCLERKNKYLLFNKFTLPVSISSHLGMKKTNTPQGVSVGKAQGTLVSKDILDKGELPSDKVILYTEVLSPDLVKYFEKISGIISLSGGMLSHLALVAREKKMPVIVGVDVATTIYHLGDVIGMNGETAEVYKT